MAISTGLLLVNFIQPGSGVDKSIAESAEIINSAPKELRDVLIEMVPDNIFKSFTNGHMLSIIFFAILFGFFITSLSVSV